MLSRRTLAIVAAALLGVAFFGGVMRLFALRFSAGGVYPPYSSLRADPLGAKAIHDALGALPGVDVQRNFRALPRLQPPGPITLVYTGVPKRSLWQSQELEVFETLVRGGSRAVFTFFPSNHPPTALEDQRAEKNERERKKEARKKEAQKKGKKAGQGKKEDEEKTEEEEDENEGLIKFAKVAKGWGFDFGHLVPPAEESPARKALAADPKGSLEPEISWHSTLYFKDLTPEWTTLYTSDGQPVVVERKFGKGSIVLAADSFFLSNEALRAERLPQLLGRVFSGPATVVFDEEHFGISEQQGVATLARKYRLHGAVAALALIAALFVWKNSTRFLPPREDVDTGDIVSGKESSEGFVNLLRRTIKPKDIVRVCVEEWRKTAPLAGRERPRLEEAWATEQARPPKERNPVATYRTLSKTVTRKT